MARHHGIADTGQGPWVLSADERPPPRRPPSRALPYARPRSHFCYPGVQHLWIYALHRALKAAGVTGPPQRLLDASNLGQSKPPPRPKFGCAEVMEVKGQEALGDPRPVSKVMRELDEEGRLGARRRELWWLPQQRRRRRLS